MQLCITITEIDRFQKWTNTLIRLVQEIFTGFVMACTLKTNKFDRKTVIYYICLCTKYKLCTTSTKVVRYFSEILDMQEKCDKRKVHSEFENVHEMQAGSLYIKIGVSAKRYPFLVLPITSILLFE